MPYTIRANDIPGCFWSVCADWHDGRSSAMYSVAYRCSEGNVNVPLGRLLSETRECLDGLSEQLQAEELPRLQQMETWCADQIKRAKASAALQRCVARAKAAGLDSDAIARIVDK